MPVKPVPDGYHTITPYFAVPDAAKLIDFLQKAFNAEVFQKMSSPDGIVMHAQLKIGDSIVMIGQTPNDPTYKLFPAMLYMYVPDADAVFRKAVDAGGKVVLEPVDQFYGDRSGAFEDPAGNQWWISTHKEDVSEEEMMKRASQQKR